MATLKDVAKLANVDPSTVSRALNNISHVHPDTKARIMVAVEQLSYRPSLLTKGLREGKHNAIAVVIPTMRFSMFSEVVEGVELQAQELGFSTTISHTKNDPAIESDCLNRLYNSFVDGIIIAGTGANQRQISSIRDTVPVLQVVRKYDEKISSVTADFFSCGYSGFEYLYKKGCRNIALINGSTELIPYRERYRGYSKAVKKYGLQENVVESPFCFIDDSQLFEFGMTSTMKLYKNNARIDGILAAMDIHGIGAIRTIKELGFSIPDQVKLVSLTGHSIGGMLEPSMTSMELPAIDMGKKAARLIIDEIMAPAGLKRNCLHCVFDTSLVKRDSA